MKSSNLKGITILLSALFAMTLLGIILVKLFSPPSTGTQQSTLTSGMSSTKKARAFIKDFNQFDKYISRQKRLAVENALYHYVYYGKPDLYTGTIRKDSIAYSKKDDAASVEFLVDIDPYTVTYRIISTKSAANGVETIEIYCAPPEQQKDSSIPCRDSRYIGEEGHDHEH